MVYSVRECRALQVNIVVGVLVSELFVVVVVKTVTVIISKHNTF